MKVKELKMHSFLKEKTQKGACVSSCVYSHEWHVAVNRNSYSLFFTRKRGKGQLIKFPGIMFKTLKEIVVVFNMMVLGTSGQDKGHKIIHFVSIYDLNNIRDYFWTQKQCEQPQMQPG